MSNTSHCKQGATTQEANMASMNVENITAKFTHPSIPRNAEEPTFEAIRSEHKFLNQNATGILHEAYGNTLGMLELTITTAAHRTLAGEDYVVPTRPTNC
eukprot:7789445-Ditylum_brightwellii.AAC.1